MIDYMAPSHRKPHVWKFRSAWFRQLLITHGWGLRGAYASKSFKGNEYMMTKLREEGPYCYYLIRRKSDFWATVSKEDRDRDARETRKNFRVVVSGTK
jgi:hypothetical protein